MGLDLSRLKINPLCGGLIWESFGKLQVRDVFSRLPAEYMDLHELGRVGDELTELSYDDLDKIIRFVIVFVDSASPLADETDFEARIKACVSILGHSQDEKYLKLVIDDHPWVNLLMYEYFKMTNSILYESWFSAKMSLHTMNMQLRNAFMKDSDRLRYMQTIKDLTAMVARMQSELFGADEVTEKIISSGATAGPKIGGYAERYALILQQ